MDKSVIKASGDEPALDVKDITPSDTKELEPPCRSIYIGTSGDVSLKTVGGTVVIFSNVPTGILPIQAVQIRETDTTASDIKALY